MPVDRGRVEAAVTELLLAIGEDPGRPGLAATPRRVADSSAEYFAGVGVDPAAVLGDGSDMEADPGELGDLVMLRDVAFRSMCEHHLVPFHGSASVGYVPGDHLVGLGRLAEVVEIAAARPQVQERLTEQIADALDVGLAAHGVLVVVAARHECVSATGPRQERSSMVTVAARGVLAEPGRRAEALALVVAPDAEPAVGPGRGVAGADAGGAHGREDP